MTRRKWVQINGELVEVDPHTYQPAGRVADSALSDLSASCVGSSVRVLFTDGGPSAIFFRVARIPVDSINRFANWSFAHVGKKVFKFHPPLAHSDPTLSVKSPLGCLGACAAVLHALPSLVRWAVVHPVLRFADFGYLLHPKASTGLRRSFRSQVAGIYTGRATAFAGASPVSSFFDVGWRFSST